MKRLKTTNSKSAVPQSKLTTQIIDAQMTQNEEWLTTADIMRHFKLSRSSLYRLRNKNQIPAFKLGGTMMFPKNFINKLMLLKSVNQTNTAFED